MAKDSEADQLLRIVYREEGPRRDNGATLPADEFAKLTHRQVETMYDFSNRRLMHRIAKYLSRKPRKVRRKRAGVMDEAYHGF